MSLADKIEGIKKIKRTAQAELEVVQKRVVPEKIDNDRERFQTLMDPKKAEKQIAANEAAQEQQKRPPMIDEARKAYQNQTPAEAMMQANDPNKLVAQIDRTVENIQKARETLALPNSRVRSSAQFLLRNRLTEINENIKTAFEHAGIEAEYTAHTRPTGFTNPLKRFLGMLTNGQKQMETLGQRIQEISEQDGPVSPGKMLLLQDRVHRIQQQIEFFTSLLNKGLESVKTIMNVQI